MKFKHIYIILAIAFIVTACNKNTSSSKTNNNDEASQQANKEISNNVENINEKKLIDFTLNDINNQPVNLLKEVSKNKITIVDFWASWCGPCMAEMPNMIAIYSEYKDKGLGIIGVSLDENKEMWTKTIKEKSLNWTHVSDLKGWHSEAARLYNVEGIPYIIVADKEGHIIAENLRGEDLENFIKSKLN